jgi:sulfonate transport system substrate-binding protein
MRKAYAWARHNQDAWASVVASEIGVPVAYVRDQFRRKSAEFELRTVTAEAIQSQQTVADVFTRAGLIPKRAAVEPLWDARFNSVITKEL